MNRALRTLRYFLIGAAGGTLGLIMAEVLFGLPDMPWWPAPVGFGLFVLVLGWFRDRSLGRRR